MGIIWHVDAKMPLNTSLALLFTRWTGAIIRMVKKLTSPKSDLKQRRRQLSKPTPRNVDSSITQWHPSQFRWQLAVMSSELDCAWVIRYLYLSIFRFLRICCKVPFPIIGSSLAFKSTTDGSIYWKLISRSSRFTTAYQYIVHETLRTIVEIALSKVLIQGSVILKKSFVLNILTAHSSPISKRYRVQSWFNTLCHWCDECDILLYLAHGAPDTYKC